MFALQDQDNRWAGARGLTGNGGLARRLRRTAVGAVCAAAVALPVAGAATAQAAASAPHPLTITWTSLALQNGWADFSTGTGAPAVTNINGIVHLKGEMATAGTNQVPFTLPAADRPATEVVVPVDLLGGTAGQLQIFPSGAVTVYAEKTWSNAQADTSLDGVSFARSGSSFTRLTLKNGWTNYGAPTASAAVRSISGIVHLRGVIRTGGTLQDPFILPVGFRPSHSLQIPVTLCNSATGQLDIYASGSMMVEAGAWSDAQCGVSLDGAWFAKSTSYYTPLKLQNGWTTYSSGFASPAVRKISGIVHFVGGIYNNADPPNPEVFTLPAGFRPSHYVYTSVDMADASKGQMVIAPGGTVTVFPETDWSRASMLTSLDGVSFAP